MKYIVVYVHIAAELGGVGELNLLAHNETDARAQANELGYPDRRILNIAVIGEQHYLEIFNQWSSGNLPHATIGARIVIRQAVTLRRLGMSFAQQTLTRLLEDSDIPADD